MTTFNLTDLKNGKPEAVDWAKTISKEELNKMKAKYDESEDSHLGQLIGVISSIQSGDFTSDNELRELAKEAFLHNNVEAKKKILEYCEVEDTNGYTDGASLAYWVCCQSSISSGLILAYAVMTGIDTEKAREIADEPELESPWSFLNYNSDGNVVFAEMIETLLYEDSQNTRWKKAPRVILRQLIEEGHSHPEIEQFLDKYKDTKWAQNLRTVTKKKEVHENAFYIILTISSIIPCVYLFGFIATSIMSSLGWIESSHTAILISGLCVLAVIALWVAIDGMIKKRKI